MSKLSILVLVAFVFLTACARSDMWPDGYYYHDTPANQAPGPEDLDWNDTEFPDHDGDKVHVPESAANE